MRETTTPREAAKDLIRSYVKRGDTVEQLRAGQMGVYSDDYRASIGGWINEKRIPTDKIVITKIRNKKLNPPAVFPLKELYNEIKAGKRNGVLLK